MQTSRSSAAGQIKVLGAALITAFAFASLLLLSSERSFVIKHEVASLPSLSPSPSPSPLPTRLPNPPKELKAVYLTSWSAGTPLKIEEIVKLIKETELNGAVIDIKDFSGKVAFVTQSPLIKKFSSEEIRIRDFPLLINRLHDENIYVKVRIAVFQDQHLVRARPDLAVKDLAGNVWRDRKGIGWVDSSSKEVWEYTAEIAKEAARLGVDEVNFDYIRFPSDGNLKNIQYPFWKESDAPRRAVIRAFFKYISEELRPLGVPISADIFGLTTINRDDLGIGQVIEDALMYFDYVEPMVYPSHYASGFIGYKNPAAYPYEVIKYSLDKAVARRAQLESALSTSSVQATSTSSVQASTSSVQATSTSSVQATSTSSVQATSTSSVQATSTEPLKIGKIRPWLQAFDLGAVYTPDMVRKQIQATYDAGLTDGWMLWNAANRYNAAALLKE